jgi:hypothetical protein
MLTLVKGSKRREKNTRQCRHPAPTLVRCGRQVSVPARKCNEPVTMELSGRWFEMEPVWG